MFVKQFVTILLVVLFNTFFGFSLFAQTTKLKTFESSKQTNEQNVGSIKISQNEKLAIQAMRRIHAAEATYQAINGQGNFGSLNDLYF